MGVRLFTHLVIAAVLPLVPSRGAERVRWSAPEMAAFSSRKLNAIQLWSGFDVVKSRNRLNASFNQYRLGMAVPITGDGYCLTAGHVVESEPVATLHLRRSPSLPLGFERFSDGKLRFRVGNKVRTQSDKPAAFRLTGVRVIHRFERADLAVVQVSFPTPGYLRTVAAPNADERFAVLANPYERTSSSSLMKTDRAHRAATSDAAGQFWTGELSVPGREGDSGSPVAGTTGKLHGVLIEKYEPPAWWPFANRRETIVRYRGVSSAVLDRIIEIDRAGRRFKSPKSEVAARR
jgi:Trypsin-like peptidase domain